MVGWMCLAFAVRDCKREGLGKEKRNTEQERTDGLALCSSESEDERQGKEKELDVFRESK